MQTTPLQLAVQVVIDCWDSASVTPTASMIRELRKTLAAELSTAAQAEPIATTRPATPLESAELHNTGVAGNFERVLAFNDRPVAVDANLRLGQILAQTMQEEKEHSLSLAEARVAKQTAEDLKKWNLVKDFLEAAKQTLTQQILEKMPVSGHGVLVGDSGSRRENEELYSLLQMYQSRVSIQDPIHPYFPLWSKFCAWAGAQGLTPKWDSRHDGAGMRSWYMLQLKLSATPIPPR